MMEIVSKIGTPIIPSSKTDPTQSSRRVAKFFDEIEERYLDIKRALKKLFDESFSGLSVAQNSRSEWMLCGNEDLPPSLFRVNAAAYVYDMSPQQLNDLLLRVQTILDDYLLDGRDDDIWPLRYITQEMERGTHQAWTNLSTQSRQYAEETTLSGLLSSPAYQNQVAAAYISAYSDWKFISDKARGDLATIISDSIGRGVNPRETARIISRRLDISMSLAKNIAQTEQVGALRNAMWLETDWAKKRLGLNTAVLHISALKPTTRKEHAKWHGKIRTTDEVREWYSRDGNKYHCYCSQIPAVLNDNGELVNKGLIEKLNKERSDWFDEFSKTI